MYSKYISVLAGLSAVVAGSAQEEASPVQGDAAMVTPAVSPPWGSDVQPVFVVSGGADQEIAQACGMVMASANVAIASMVSSMASAGVQTWDAPAPTMTMALGGANREEQDFAECVERGIEAAPPAPWGNGVPPKVVITPGRVANDARVCQQGAGMLTSALYSYFGQVSMSRAQHRNYDARRPTMTFAGADCATRYNGNADNIPGFQIYKTRGLPRPTPRAGPPRNPLNPINLLPPPRVTAPRPAPVTVTPRPYTYTQIPPPATVTLAQPPPVVVTPRPVTQVAPPATVTVTPRPYTTVAPRPVVTITLPAGAPPPQGAQQQQQQQQQGPRGPPPSWSEMQQGGANWGPPQPQPGGYPQNPRGAPRGNPRGVPRYPDNGPGPYQGQGGYGGPAQGPYNGPQGPYNGPQGPYNGPGPYQGQQGGYNGPAPWRGQGRQ